MHTTGNGIIAMCVGADKLIVILVSFSLTFVEVGCVDNF